MTDEMFPRRREKPKKRSPLVAILAFLGGVGSAAGAVILSIAYEELRAPSEAAVAAADLVEVLEPRADQYRELSDSLRIKAPGVANAMLYGRPALEVQTTFDGFRRDWSDYQTVYADLMRLGAGRSAAARPIAELAPYLRTAASATKRVNTCLEAATASYRPQAAGIMAEMAQADEIPASLSCRSGPSRFQLSAEIVLIDRCNTAIRRSLTESIDTIRGQGDGSLIAGLRRQIRRLGGREATASGAPTGLDAGSADRLKEDCAAQLQSPRVEAVGPDFPWQDMAALQRARVTNWTRRREGLEGTAPGGPSLIP